MRKSKRVGRGMALAILVGVASSAFAQYHGGYGQAVDAAIMSDISRDRQEERDAKRVPYASPGYGPIGTSKEAAQACGADALREAGGSPRLAGSPVARTMATGWEVEGAVDQGPGTAAAPFVCSVRNGSVSGLIFR